MRYHLIKNKLLSTLLVFALLFTLLPTTAWAAAAIGTASGTAGYNNIAVSLSGASQFAADADVQNTSNWELIPTGGTQTILGITKHNPQYVSIVLSAPIQAGQAFTIDAAAEVFAPGTDMFLAPLDVNITIPTPATGTAEATAGMKEIAVALTTGTFGSESAVETKSFWTLGGDSASENPIASVTFLDSTHATVTLTNNIGASDTYTITAAQFVFVNAAIAPFASPLLVTVEPAGSAAPPTLVSAAVTAEGGVGLNFDKELSPTDLVAKVQAGFTVKGLEETPKTITNATLHSNAGGTNNFIQLYLDPTVKGGEAVSLSYTPSAVQSLDGGILAAISSMEITNGLLHPELNTSAPPTATKGLAYTHTLAATGGTGPYTFSVDSGNLPSGLTMSSTGVISGTPTVAASFTFFIMVQDANQAVDIEGFSITVSPPTDKVCEIGGTQYATLDAALADVPAGGTATVKLLSNINHNAGVFLEGKKITFALNGYTLNINNPAAGGFGLAVQQGGAVYLSGSGALNATGETYGVRVSTSVLPTQATVTSATATGPTGEAAYAAGPATLTVLEDTTVTGVNAYGAHAISKAMIDIKGNVNASNQGVYASDAIIKVAGNVTAAGLNLLNEPVGIGVGVYGGTGAVEIGGNVTANRVGAMVRAGGSITIDGMLTAPAYIQFADDEPTAIEDFITQTTKTGYRTYQHPTAGTVWMLGEMPTTTYALNVINGTGNGSYAKNEVVTITANAAPVGQRFKEWSITPSVTFVDGTSKASQAAKFTMPALAVTATATYEALPASQYSITVQNDGYGTASANFNTAAEGAEITLTATPNNGYRFKEWQVISGGVTVVNNKFSMLDANVTVKAIFEPVPAASYNVAVNGSYAGTNGAGSYAKDATVTIHAGSRSSYSFTGWTSTDGVAFMNAGSATTNFTMPAKNVTVTANWSYNGGGGGGSSPSDGGNKSYIITPPATPERPNPPTTAETKVSATVDGSGKASANVSDKAVVDAIKVARDAAKKNGTEKNGIAVSVNITTDKETNSLAVTLSKNAVSELVKAGVTELRITSGTITVSFDLTALKQFDQAGGAMTLTANRTDVSKLSAAARTAIGSRPVFDFSVQCGGKTVSGFGGGLASLAIPYTLGANEKTGNLFGVYVDANGKVNWLTGSSYDKSARLLRFSVAHFSIFGIGYKADAPVFTDIANHWAKEDIEFVAARGLFSGTGNNQFSPSTGMTRGMFVTALGRLAGIDATAYKNNNNQFADVPASAYYASYVAWAAEKGIISGTGVTTFEPDQNISRQEMAVIMSNYSKVMGYSVLENREEVSFSDNANIASWAEDAVKSMQTAGILMGKDENHFAPTASTTRAEVAAVFHRYVDLVIGKAMTQGGDTNDSGKRM